MYVAEKRRVHPRSFHHRIRDGAVRYFNTDHLLGMDPMDHSRFRGLYEKKKESIKWDVLSEEDTHHLISNW